MAGIGERYLAEIEAELKACVPAEGGADLLYTMMRYHLGWIDRRGRATPGAAGKRIRPLLCLVVCEGYGTEYRRALPAAAAIELLHNFTLIHDDVQDRSDERRHRPTVWRIWGEAQAINAGDAMYALARLAVLRLAERGASDRVVLAAAELLDRTCLRVCEGQVLDLSFEENLDVSKEAYMAMIERKTAALLGCAAEMGALVGGAGPAEQLAMRHFGERLGLAYQVQDDVLGIWGDPSVTGKPAADDIRRRKKTLPIIHALACGTAKQKEQLRSLFSAPSPTDAQVDEVMQLLGATGARRAAEDEAARLYRETEHWLATARIAPQTVTILRDLVSSLLLRPA